MTIPSLTPILDAVRDVRAKFQPDTAEWSADILAGDPQALAAGRELFDATNQLADDLTALTGADIEVAGLIGVGDVIDAVLVATGEADSDDDPAVSERFRPARMAFHRHLAERYMGELLDVDGRELTEGETQLLAQCRGDLALIAAGIEPS